MPINSKYTNPKNKNIRKKKSKKSLASNELDNTSCNDNQTSEPISRDFLCPDMQIAAVPTLQAAALSLPDQWLAKSSISIFHLMRGGAKTVNALKLKAVFILLLVVGHEAVRIDAGLLSRNLNLVFSPSFQFRELVVSFLCQCNSLKATQDEISSISQHLLSRAGSPKTPSEWAVVYREANWQCSWDMAAWQCVGANGGCEMRRLLLDRPRPFSDHCRLSVWVWRNIGLMSMSMW